MKRINLSVERSFSDMVTDTFNFLKSEFLGILKTFAILVLPIVLIGSYFMSDAIAAQYAAAFGGYDYMSMDEVLSMLYSLLFNGLIYFWLMLYSISYLKVYWMKYQAGNSSEVSTKEVFDVMISKFLIFFAWCILYSLMVGIGFAFLFIPGIYLLVLFTFVPYFLIINNKSIGDGMSDTNSIMKGNWWKLFGLSIVLGLLVGLMSTAFSIPSIILSVQYMLTQIEPSEETFMLATMLATIGKFLLYPIVFIGMGIMFFSLLERKDHTTLLSQIDKIGEKKEDEMGY